MTLCLKRIAIPGSEGRAETYCMKDRHETDQSKPGYEPCESLVVVKRGQLRVCPDYETGVSIKDQAEKLFLGWQTKL